MCGKKGTRESSKMKNVPPNALLKEDYEGMFLPEVKEDYEGVWKGCALCKNTKRPLGSSASRSE